MPPNMHPRGHRAGCNAQPDNVHATEVHAPYCFLDWKHGEDRPHRFRSHSDNPFDETAKSATAQTSAGARIYQKFTCEACGNRLTMEAPNTLYSTGTCDQCGHVTNIRKNGMNFILVKAVPDWDNLDRAMADLGLGPQRPQA